MEDAAALAATHQTASTSTSLPSSSSSLPPKPSTTPTAPIALDKVAKRNLARFGRVGSGSGGGDGKEGEGKGGEKEVVGQEAKGLSYD